MKKSIIKITLLLILFSCQKDLREFDYIFNSSFEKGWVEMGALPDSWRNCASRDYSSPDLHDVNSNHWGVKKQPIDGNNFVGLVTRSDGSAECMEQPLTSYLESGNYCVEIIIGSAKEFVATDILTQEEASYTKRIYLDVVAEKINNEEVLFSVIPKSSLQ